MRCVRPAVLLAVLFLVPACGGVDNLPQVVQPPRFVPAPGRSAEISLMPPTAGRPAGGAGITLWLEVTNPNPFGFTLSHVDATLLIEGTRAGTGAFPLGLPLGAGQTSVIPLDLSISFEDLPALATTIQRAVAGNAIGYELEGTVGIDVGPLTHPLFGPMQLASGSLRIGG